MGVTVTLSRDELAQVKQLTQIDSDSEAIGQAVREFLRLYQLRQLQSISGHVDFVDQSEQLESLELGEIGFPA